MPIHDWHRVDANLYHHFHQFWTTEICRSLNAGLLPIGYSALVEQFTAGREPDVLAVERRPKRDRSPRPTVGTLLAVPPKTRHVVTVEERLAQRGNQITITHRLGEVVCVIEVVSPGNKHSQLAFKEFRDKAVAFLRNGVHLLIVDLFPPTPRDPHGLPQALLEIFGDPAVECTADKPLSLSAYQTGVGMTGFGLTAYVEPVAVGDVMKDMPAYLDTDQYVPVPLEASYEAAWASCPADMRELVETGKLAGEDE
jgi:hypothetical protein